MELLGLEEEYGRAQSAPTLDHVAAAICSNSRLAENGILHLSEEECRNDKDDTIHREHASMNIMYAVVMCFITFGCMNNFVVRDSRHRWDLQTSNADVWNIHWASSTATSGMETLLSHTSAIWYHFLNLIIETCMAATNLVSMS